MCLAIPMRIVEMSGQDCGVAEAEQVRYRVDLSLIDTPRVGEYVIVHAGFAIEKLDSDEADRRIALFHELAVTENKKK